jgi:hypothetical protein
MLLDKINLKYIYTHNKITLVKHLFYKKCLIRKGIKKKERGE